MRKQTLAPTLAILLAIGCGGGGGSTADANTQTGTATTTTNQVDAPQSGPESGGAATSTGINATATGTGTGTSATGTKTSTGTSATGTATGTGTGATGTGTGTGTGGTGACNFPSCFNDLVAGCNPGGTCIEQSGYMCGTTVCPQPPTSVPTSMFTYLCYSNGVTVATTVDMTNPASMISIETYKKNGTVCYSVEMPVSAANPNSIAEIVKDPSGTTVATYVINQTARTVTITCTGGSPSVVSLDCLTSSSRDGGTPCTTGTCTP